MSSASLPVTLLPSDQPHDVSCYTMMNGGSFFRVAISPTEVKLYMKSADNDVNESVSDWRAPAAFPDHALTLSNSWSKVFIGHDDMNVRKGPNYAAQAHGNSVLVRLAAGDNKYVFINQNALEFVPIHGEEITEFFAPVGNSEVPYPFALSATHTYLMEDKSVAVIPNSCWITSADRREVTHGNPYDWYYDHMQDPIVQTIQGTVLAQGRD
jgi:hypothetical protein